MLPQAQQKIEIDFDTRKYTGSVEKIISIKYLQNKQEKQRKVVIKAQVEEKRAVIKNLSLIRAKRLIDKSTGQADFVMLDVRPDSLIKKYGHITDAYQMDFSQKELLLELPRATSYFIYDYQGTNSAKLAKYLRENDFKDINNLLIGFKSWKIRGYEYQKGNEKMFNIIKLIKAYKVHSIDIKTARNFIDSAMMPIILDVRRPLEYKEAHIDMAINIDWYASDFLMQIKELDRHKHYLIYCRSGVRSKKATILMQKNGFVNCTEMTGGILAWQAGGYATKP